MSPYRIQKPIKIVLDQSQLQWVADPSQFKRKPQRSF